MPIDPATILYVLPKPGGREAVLLRRLSHRGVVGLEITVARPSPDGRFYAVRGVGIGPDLLRAFAEAAPVAVGAVLAAEAPTAPLAAKTASRGPQTEISDR